MSGYEPYDPEDELAEAAWLLLFAIVGIAVALIALGYCVGRHSG